MDYATDSLGRLNGFERRVSAVEPDALSARGLSLLELNVGLRCNMACAHCHQSSSPTRTECMSDDVFDAALAAARRVGPALVDVTGGAPEMHPKIADYLRRLHDAGFAVRLRTNLTVLLEPDYADLPRLFARLGVRLMASLPSWDDGVAAPQRGRGAVERSIESLRRLNALGYGQGEGLVLDIAHNPPGAQLPGSQGELERLFRHELATRFGLRFDQLLTCANIPAGRLKTWLRATGQERQYLEALRAAFNPATVPLLACRDQAVVAWDGTLWDCDYNLGARLEPAPGTPSHVERLDRSFGDRRIAFASHCFGCTAGAGSS